jgi:hypothetical protein
MRRSNIPAAALAALLIATSAVAQSISPGTPLPSPPGGASGDVQTNNGAGGFSGVTVLTVPHGGTGLAAPTAHDVLVGAGASAIVPVSPGTSGFVLTSNGTGADPSFQAAAAGGCTTTCTYTGKQTITLGAANTSALATSGGSNTGSNTTPMLDLAWTLNNTSGAVDVIRLATSCVTACANANLINIYGGASGTTSMFKVDATGHVTTFDTITSGGHVFAAFQLRAGGNSTIGWAGEGLLTSQAAGEVRFGDLDAGPLQAQTIKFQGTTGTNQSGANTTIIGSIGTGSGLGGDIIFQVAPAGSGSGGSSGQNTPTTAFTISQKGVPKLPGFTVSTLPTSPPTGSMAYVTDATTCTFLGALTGGSNNFCPVIYNGAAWVGG